MIAKERGNVTPLLRLGRGQGEHGRFHTAGFPKSDNAMPLLVGDGILDLFLVVSARPKVFWYNITLYRSKTI
jgi:hypothetical protein